MDLDAVVRDLVRAEIEPIVRELETLRRELREIQSRENLLTVKEFCGARPEWTIGAVRSAIFNREELGLGPALHQPTGKRGKMKIDAAAFVAIMGSRTRRRA
jgi:hypothetical protein